jgi:hypothetical protein
VLALGGNAQADDAGAKAPGPVDSSAPMPAGHPQVEPDDDTDDQDPHAAHGHGGAAPGAGMFQPGEDTANEDPSLPKGTIAVQIVDADGKPQPKIDVTLGIIYNSVAKGESRKRVMVATDDKGVAHFGDLDAGAGIAYRAMVLVGGATFSAPPFQLPLNRGIRATLHVYPLEHDVEKTLVVSQSILYAEVKDDRIQIQQALRIYNFGKTAWVASDLLVPLPAEFTAFTSQQGMTDVGADAVPKKGVKIRGTFTPGQHVVEFRWQLPYTGEADVMFDVGMTPHCAAARVIAPASRKMTLAVDDFPTPQATNDAMGQRALVTERQMRRDEKPLTSMRVHLNGLPTEGPAKYIATLLAAGAVAFGLFLGSSKPSRADTTAERKRLLAELELLERAKASGDVGPRTYERTRGELIDAIARTFAADPQPRASGKKKKSA